MAFAAFIRLQELERMAGVLEDRLFAPVGFVKRVLLAYAPEKRRFVLLLLQPLASIFIGAQGSADLRGHPAGFLPG